VHIVETTAKKGLSPESIEQCADSTAVLAERLDLTPIQAMFLSVFVDQCDDNTIRVNDIAGHFECRNIHIMRHNADIDTLVERCYIRRREEDRRDAYRVPKEVVAALQTNEPYSAPSTKGLTIEKLFEELARLFEMCSDKEMNSEVLIAACGELLRDNTHLAFSSKVVKLGLDEDDEMLLALFCHRWVNEEDDNIMGYQLEPVFEYKCHYRRLMTNLKAGCHPLMTRDLLEVKVNEGLSGRDVYHLTDHAKQELLSELGLDIKEQQKPKNILYARDIVEKPLYYNTREQTDIDRLVSLLDGDNFAKVQRRLAKNGMRKGFACLFYGAPGTGKTETVYQVARRTGRDILYVNVNE